VPANAAITLISAWTQAASNDQTQPKHNGPTGRVAKDRQTVDRQAADSATDTRPPSTAAAAHAAAADEKSHFPSLRAGNGAQSLRCYQHRSYSEAVYHFSLVISDLGLRASAGPVLSATGLVNGRWQFSTPPTQSTPVESLTNHQIFVTRDYVAAAPNGCAKCGANPSMGASGQMGEI